MHEILEISEALEIAKEVEYENSFGFRHKLKIIDPVIAEQYYKETN